MKAELIPNISQPLIKVAIGSLGLMPDSRGAYPLVALYGHCLSLTYCLPARCCAEGTLAL